MSSFMERSEPALVPEWLKNSTSSTGSSALSLTDGLSAPRVSKHKSFVNSNGHNQGRPSGFEKASSAYFRRDFSENSSDSFRSYSGSGRNHRDKEWENDEYGSRDQGKFLLEDRRHRKFVEPDGNSLFSSFERDGLRRTQSVMPGKRGDTQPRRGATDLSAGGRHTEVILLSKGCLPSGTNKANFERDFPSLGTDERAGLPDVRRVPSPGLTTAIQSLQISNSTSVGDKWTSALAEVPMLFGSNGPALSSALHAASSGYPSVSLGANAGFNMAEALTVRTQTAPQLSVESQRREELAIKQSRQLIPVTPSMPKSLALNLSDKAKSKVAQVPSPLASSAQANHSTRSGDASKSSNPGNFHVLKSAREKNGVAFGMKDNLSPRSSSKVGSSVSAPPVTGARNQINKPMMPVPDKRPSCHAQSRNEFFNLVRKKSMGNSSTSDSDISNSANARSPLFSEKNSEMNGDAQNQHMLTCNGDGSNDQKLHMNGKVHPIIIKEEEEEAAFLKSLGWEENDDEGGLTEEEITCFRMNLTKYIDSNPSPRILQGNQLACLLPFNGKGISTDVNPEP